MSFFYQIESLLLGNSDMTPQHCLSPDLHGENPDILLPTSLIQESLFNEDISSVWKPKREMYYRVCELKSLLPKNQIRVEIF